MKPGFRAKVLLAITAITVCTSLAICLIYLARSRDDIESNYIQALWKTMSVSLASFDENARQAYDTAVSLSFNEALAAQLSSYNGTDTEASLRISSFLDGEMGVDNAKHIYVYLPALSQTITSTEYHAVQQLRPDESAHISADAPGLSPQLVYDEVARVPEYVLSYRRRMDIAGAEPPVISVNLDERRIFYQYLDGIGTNGGDTYYMLDQDGRIVSAASQRVLGRSFTEVTGVSQVPIPREQSSIAFVDGADKLVAAVRSPMTGYTLAAVADRKALTASLTRQRNFFIGLLAAAMLIMLIPAYHMSGRVYAPVKKLKIAMQRVSEGDLSARASVYSSDEIGQLGEGFNEMVDRIEGLIDDLVSEQMQKKEAELEALQYQITPHFMYNTLNSIKYAAILQGNIDVGEQLTAFIELLQASISRGGAFIPVKDETRMVQNYVKLQQFRYQDSIIVHYDLSAEAAPYYVPRLILQPLVENAILHGQSAQTGKCEITISTGFVNGTVVLAVQDAGDGMSREQIAKLTASTQMRHGGFSGIGVPNIIERLRLYYGTAASLNFTSGEHGTKATIFLPAAENPEEYMI